MQTMQASPFLPSPELMRSYIRPLAQVKKKLRAKYTSDELERVCWSYEQIITLQDPDYEGDEILDCTLDYVLSYGKQPDLETNLVVICAEEPINDAERYAPIVAAVG
jgi:5S rRNA maturation endonuclease (ribonuclease M5)